jgi:poly (ADP-ribose) glycohydrolase (PARG)-like protein
MTCIRVAAYNMHQAIYSPISETTSYTASRDLETYANASLPETPVVMSGDPVDQALAWQAQKRGFAESQTQVSQIWIPVICGANDKRPGGDWETGVQGYEERLCRRSSLSATLATPAPESQGAELGSNFPVPSTGGIYSPCVGEYSLSISYTPSSSYDSGTELDSLTHSYPSPGAEPSFYFTFYTR